jgi:hypothetical protein
MHEGGVSCQICNYLTDYFINGKSWPISILDSHHFALGKHG